MSKGGKVKLKINYKGVGELRTSGEMQDALISYASKVANNAGDGYEVWVGSNTQNVLVKTATAEAESDNLKNNTLLKAMK